GSASEQAGHVDRPGDSSSLSDQAGSMAEASRRGTDWRAWPVFVDGRYRSFLDEAAAAVASLRARPPVSGPFGAAGRVSVRFEELVELVDGLRRTAGRLSETRLRTLRALSRLEEAPRALSGQAPELSEVVRGLGELVDEAGNEARWLGAWLGWLEEDQPATGPPVIRLAGLLRIPEGGSWPVFETDLDGFARGAPSPLLVSLGGSDSEWHAIPDWVLVAEPWPDDFVLPRREAGTTSSLLRGAHTHIRASLVGAVGLPAAPTAPAGHGPYDYPGSRAVEVGRAELGAELPSGWNQPGHPQKAIQRWITGAGGRYRGGGVVSGYLASGAIPVRVADAGPGDVVQYTMVTAPDRWSPATTPVLVSARPDRRFDVLYVNVHVDGAGTGRVEEIHDWQPAPPDGCEARAWRFGRVGE
ncbi:MAG: hypothetical protein J2O39_09305, partial [Acidimicrobiales bacterium]|nr:hypothetical protein [Acidimicrobiales bacterium]